MSELTVSNDITELDRVNAWLTAIDEIHRLSESDIHNLLFVIEELFVNIVQYGFNDEQEHTIKLTESSVREEFQVTLSDDGIPFDPTAQPHSNRKLNREQRCVGGEGIKCVCDGRFEGIDGAGGNFPKDRLDLGKGLFDRVEVRAVWREEQHPGACGLGGAILEARPGAAARGGHLPLPGGPGGAGLRVGPGRALVLG